MMSRMRQGPSDPRVRRFCGVTALLGVILLLAGVALLTSCNSQPAKAADGLDLHALVGVVRQSTNGEDLEKRLNSSGGINNLDLDADGKVDFINVTEFGEGEFRGYSLAVHLDEKNTQEVAKVEIHSGPNDFTIQITGNPQIYGNIPPVVNRVVRNSPEFRTAPFLLWAFTPRPLYIPPPLVVGVYPSWYVRPIVVPVTQYRTVTKVVTKTVVVERPRVPVVQAPPTVVNPNAGKTATTIKAPLAAPTATQQQFQARPENKPVATGGFGANKTAPVVTSPRPQDTSPQQKATVPGATQRQFEQRAPDRPVSSGGFGNNRGTSAPSVSSPAPRPSTPAPSPSKR